MARTVKNPWHCTVDGEKPATEEVQAVKLGGSWWTFKTADGRELQRACFRITSNVVGGGWLMFDAGKTQPGPDEFLDIPDGILSPGQ